MASAGERGAWNTAGDDSGVGSTESLAVAGVGGGTRIARGLAAVWAQQDRAVALFEELAAQTGLDEPLPWARRHRDVIRRFGRFPHRNDILGRVSTPEEVAFLKEPGSRF